MNFINQKLLLKLSIFAIFTLLFVQCDNDKNDPDTEVSQNYFVAIEYTANDDYLSFASDLTSGEISPINNGFAQAGWTTFFQGEDQVFSFHAASAGGSQLNSYHLENGSLVEGDFLTVKQIYAVDVVDESTMVVIGGEFPKTIYLINTDTMTITSQVDTYLGDHLATTGSGFISLPSDIKVVGDKMFVPFSIYDPTQFLIGENIDVSYMAVYSYPSFEFEKVISDDRLGNLGRYFTTASFAEDENQDLYTFAPASLAAGHVLPTALPSLNSAIVKIANGTTEFDTDYYFDFQTVSGGYKLHDMFYVGNGKAVVSMVNATNDVTPWGGYFAPTGSGIIEYGIVDLYEQSFTALTGDIELNSGGYFPAALVEENTVYIGVSNENYSGIYIIDVDDATVTEGADIDGNYAKAILSLK